MDKCGQWNRNGWCYKLCSGQWDLPKSLKPATYEEKQSKRPHKAVHSLFPHNVYMDTGKKNQKIIHVFPNGLFWKHMQININVKAEL